MGPCGRAPQQLTRGFTTGNLEIWGALEIKSPSDWKRNATPPIPCNPSWRFNAIERKEPSESEVCISNYFFITIMEWIMMIATLSCSSKLWQIFSLASSSSSYSKRLEFKEILKWMIESLWSCTWQVLVYELLTVDSLNNVDNLDIIFAEEM